MALLLIGCVGGASSAPQARDDTTALLESYYAGQDARAYGMLQKHIFENMLESWAEGLENPVWEFDSFTGYQMLDSGLEPEEGQGELYCCGFSADGGKTGYVVVQYQDDGPSLRMVASAQTPYLYDLRANLEKVSAELEKAGVDLATAAASRVSVAGEEGRAGEAVRITDAAGHLYLYRF